MNTKNQNNETPKALPGLTDKEWLALKDYAFVSKVGGEVYSITLGDFPVNAVEAFLKKGAQRLPNDKVSGVDIDQKAKEVVEYIAQLRAGIVSTRKAGIRWSDNELAIVAVVGKILRAKDKGKAELKGLTGNELKQHLVNRFDNLPTVKADKLGGLIEEKRKEIVAERKRKAEQALLDTAAAQDIDADLFD